MQAVSRNPPKLEAVIITGDVKAFLGGYDSLRARPIHFHLRRHHMIGDWRTSGTNRK